MPALPPNSLILITGISGYIASHAGLCALKSGYRLRGTIRSWARAESLRDGYEKQGLPAAELDKRLEFVIVDDLESEGQWSKALKDVDGVIHAALPTDNAMEPRVISDAVAGQLSLLRAAKKIPSIKRVVFTSSLAAVASAPITYDKVLTVEDWNDGAVNTVEKNLPVDYDPILKRASPFFFYAAAKVKAEKAGWEFVKQTSFDFVTILPGTCVGPLIHGGAVTTAKWVMSGLQGDTTVSRTFPLEGFVDVRDCGKLHFLALTTPAMGGKRFFASPELFGWNKVFGILRKNFPSAPVPEDFEEGETYAQKVDDAPSTELMGEWISMEQSLIDLGKSLGY